MVKKKKEAKKEEEIDLVESYNKTEQYLEENKKSITIIILAVILLFGGYFSYTKLYLEPRQEEAAQQIWKAEYYFEIDSLRLALEGDGNYYGFYDIAERYSGTRTAALANYYIGSIMMKQGEYDYAIAYFNDADLDDKVIGAMAKGAMGDAYVELGDYSEAIRAYDRAISHHDNGFSTPLFLFKQALVYEEVGDYASAADNYRRIKEDYNKSIYGRDAEKYLAKAEALAG